MTWKFRMVKKEIEDEEHYQRVRVKDIFCKGCEFQVIYKDFVEDEMHVWNFSNHLHRLLFIVCDEEGLEKY